MRTIKEHYNTVNNYSPEQTCLLTALYGSQNYNLATENSDVDTKSLVLPKQNRLFFAKQISTDIKVGEGKAGIKDLRQYFKCLIKPSLNFLEILYTPNVIVNPCFQDFYNFLVENRQTITELDKGVLIRSFIGIAFDWKDKFVTNKTYINMKFNVQFADRLLKGESFEKCLIPEEADLMRQIKFAPRLGDKYLSYLITDELNKLTQIHTYFENNRSKFVPNYEAQEWLEYEFHKYLTNYLNTTEYNNY